MTGKPSNKLLVLHEAIGPDARPDEVDTLVQVEEVSQVLRSQGWNVSRLETTLDLESTLAGLRQANPACVFNLVESLGGKGSLVHLVPALLQSTGLPYTGCQGDAMYLSSQKRMAKQWMRHHDIPTAAVLDQDEYTADERTWIVKSLWEHASFGLDDGCVVSGAGAARLRLAQSSERLGGDWFAEEYIDGQEFNISILEINGQPRILPIAEIAFVDYPHGKPRIVGYAAKWDEQAPEYGATRRFFPSLSGSEQGRLDRLAIKCWSAFSLRGYARVDIRLDTAGRPWVLEINANPCLARDAGFSAAAMEAGISYEQLIERIVQTALGARTEKPGRSIGRNFRSQATTQA
jgi:D-alanine-D-alanine ligase